MARNGTGSFLLAAGNPVVDGSVISTSWANNTLNDIAAGISQSLSKDGQTVPTADQPMGGFKLTGIGNSTSRTGAPASGQVQDSSFLWLSSVTGVDTITAVCTPNITAYAAGQTFRFVSAGANITTSVTIAIDGLAAKSITKAGSTPLLTSDIPSGAVVEIVYDGTRFQMISGSGGGNGATGGFGDRAFFENDITIAHDYTITTNKNAMSAGPVTLASGVNITVPSGSVWSII